jgi:hypothetical protein
MPSAAGASGRPSPVDGPRGSISLNLIELGLWCDWCLSLPTSITVRAEFSPIDISYTPAPQWIKLMPTNEVDRHTTFWSLAELAFPEARKASFGNPAQSPRRRTTVHPNEHLVCHDYLYYVGASRVHSASCVPTGIPPDRRWFIGTAGSMYSLIAHRRCEAWYSARSNGADRVRMIINALFAPLQYLWYLLAWKDVFVVLSKSQSSTSSLCTVGIAGRDAILRIIIHNIC